ncbi:unnamed protein product [Musa banksii]
MVSCAALSTPSPSLLLPLPSASSLWLPGICSSTFLALDSDLLEYCSHSTFFARFRASLPLTTSINFSSSGLIAAAVEDMTFGRILAVFTSGTAFPPAGVFEAFAKLRFRAMFAIVDGPLLAALSFGRIAVGGR